MRKKNTPYTGEPDITKMTKTEFQEMLSKTPKIRNLTSKLTRAKMLYEAVAINNAELKARLKKFHKTLSYFRDKYEPDNRDAEELIGSSVGSNIGRSAKNTEEKVISDLNTMTASVNDLKRERTGIAAKNHYKFIKGERYEEWMDQSNRDKHYEGIGRLLVDGIEIHNINRIHFIQGYFGPRLMNIEFKVNDIEIEEGFPTDIIE